MCFTGMILRCNLLRMDDFGASGIGRRVRAYRRAAGMTADQLADRVDGLTGNAVAKLENGYRKEVSTDLLVHLAWALQVPPMALLLPIENPRAEIRVGDEVSTLEALSSWIEGMPKEETYADTHEGTRLASMILAEHRKLARSLTAMADALVDAARSREEGNSQMEAMHRGIAAGSAAQVSDSRHAIALLRDQLSLGGQDG